MIVVGAEVIEEEVEAEAVYLKVTEEEEVEAAEVVEVIVNQEEITRPEDQNLPDLIIPEEANLPTEVQANKDKSHLRRLSTNLLLIIIKLM